ncbi:hypothetical protein AYI69_g9974 [Smittium culicis]|uniref:Uncharacterized protein n=1 Tax=Smittium culicis TaxID=133412 RepID=A0A1R1X926_9FUNG|nr:hypothetical protein AYI69_g9974 [Smittium culicis]
MAEKARLCQISTRKFLDYASNIDRARTGSNLAAMYLDTDPPYQNSSDLDLYKIPGYTCIESKSDMTKGGTGLLLAVINKSGLEISDYNMDVPESKIFVSKLGTGFQLAKVTKDRGLRWNNYKVGRMIDHIYYSGFKERVNWCTAKTRMDASNHMAITAEWNCENFRADPKK